MKWRDEDYEIMSYELLSEYSYTRSRIIPSEYYERSMSVTNAWTEWMGLFVSSPLRVTEIQLVEETESWKLEVDEGIQLDTS